jgi:hypothetical protein
MKLAKLTKISLGLLLVWSATAQAEVVGRVLVSVGDNAALRAGKEVKLVAGTPVETGDTLRVGDASNLQVRFTDEAIMALRPNSSVRIDDYAFANKTESDKSIFSLLKGGLRTITGVIGRNSRSNYAVKTETSTIGIRGTHFNLVDCKGDCRNPDGTLGQNGTFGGVTDGRISVTNEAGEREFGKNEFFHVLSKTDLPVGLISPPGFLRDRLEGQAKTKGKDKGPSGGAGSESAGRSGGSSASTQPTISASATIPTTGTITGTGNYVPSEQPVIASSVMVSWVDAWGWSSGYGWEIGSDSSGDFGEQLNSSEFASIQSFLSHYEQGFSADAGNVHWGWVPETGGTGDHWAYGDAMAGLPTSGIYTFTHVGGTVPTNNEGKAGGLDYASPFTINFGAKTINGYLSYWVPAPTAIGSGSIYYNAQIHGLIDGGPGSSTLTCSGGSYGCTPMGMTSSGTGFGNPLKGIAMGVATSAMITYLSTTVPQTTATVQVYKRQ